MVGAYSEYGSYGRAENALIDPLGTGAVPHDNFAASGWNYAYKYDVPSQFFDWLAVKGKAPDSESGEAGPFLTPEALRSLRPTRSFIIPVKTTDPSGIRDTGNIFQANSSGGTATRVVTGATTSQRTGDQCALQWRSRGDRCRPKSLVRLQSAPDRQERSDQRRDPCAAHRDRTGRLQRNRSDRIPQINQARSVERTAVGAERRESSSADLKRQTTIKSSKGHSRAQVASVMATCSAAKAPTTRRRSCGGSRSASSGQL